MEMTRKEIIDIRDSSLIKAKEMTFNTNQRLFIMMSFLCDELLENMGPSSDDPDLRVSLVLSRVSHQPNNLDGLLGA